MNKFGDFLYELRKEKGLTQAELAQRLGVSNKAVSKWETGEAMPETSLLLPIARIFDITVDELLDGKHGTYKQATESQHEPVESEKTSTSDSFKQHLFTRGKEDEENKTLLDLICGAVCASVFLIGLACFLIVGVILNLWHPYWVIIPTCALLCGVVGCSFDLFNKRKKNQKIGKGQNPYTGPVCGIVMLVCIISYLLLSTFLNLWHPLWIIPACGAVACGIIGTFGDIFFRKKT